jgi:hypothetical protein
MERQRLGAVVPDFHQHHFGPTWCAVEHFLRDVDAWCWRYRENVRNYPGLHFTAKPKTCDALLACLELLTREGDGSYRTVLLKHLRPEDERKVTGGQKYECFPRMRISLFAASERLRQMSFRVEDGLALFDFTATHLADFERGLRDVQGGTGDYSIFPAMDQKQGKLLGDLDKRSVCLWFWPCFGHLSVVE